MKTTVTENTGAGAREEQKTNSLIYTDSKLIGNGERLSIQIKLNDSCKNGHQDFSITGEITKNGHPQSFGCLHDQIKKHFPQFNKFISLHGRDFTGAPTYAIGNGFYHLRQAREGEETAESFQNYLRINKNYYFFFPTPM